ncbi:hypothetical protein [Kocuria sp. U4B]
MSPAHRTAQELIAELKEKAAMSNREIAGALGRDPSLVSQIARGKKSGAHYVRALTELSSTGTVTHRPERRRTRAGTPANVRGRRGEPSHQPADLDPNARYAPVPRRGRYVPEKTHYLRSGGRIYATEFPKTKGSKGNEAGWKRIERQIRSAARRRYGRKDRPPMRVSFDITFSNGRQMRLGEKGGYDIQQVVRAIAEHGGSIEGWIKDQGQQRYLTLDTGTVAVTGVQMSVTPWQGRD